MTLYDHVRLHSKQKGSRLLVLLFIASHLDSDEQPSQKRLADDARMSVRQVTRIVDALELSGELKVDRSGGHTAHRYAILNDGSDNDANLSTLNKRQHGRLTAQMRPATAAQTDTTNDDNLSTLSDPSTSPTCHVNMATLPPNVDNPSTSNDANLSGTPVAPSKAETISSNTSQVSPSAQLGVAPSRRVVQHPSAKPETDHGRMMRELASRLGGVPDGGKQGKYAKWLLEHGHTVDESVACLDEMLAELKDPLHWRDGKVDWGAVASNISAWKLKREGLEAHGKSDVGTQNGAGRNPQAAGQSSRREQSRAELRRQAATPMFTGTPTRKTG